MNPYDPPTANEDSDGTCTLTNPVKPLLYVIGAFGLLQGVIAVPVGLFVGAQVLGAAITMLAFGSTALWLGQRKYDRFGRYGTIAWGGLAVLLVLVATGLQPPSTQDAAAMVFIGLLLVVVGTVFVVAVWKQSGGPVS